MVSLFEQYETETQIKSEDYSDEVNLYRTAYLGTSFNSLDNEDIFKSQKIQINIQDRKIDQFEQCSGQIAILFKPNTIRLLNSEQKTDETIEYPDVINKLFLDKSGKHLLVSTEKNELYYYSKYTRKNKSISKLKVLEIIFHNDIFVKQNYKGNLVTAVGWNKNSTDKTTDSIIVGTSKGVLYELIINSSNEGLLSVFGEFYCKQIYSFNNDQSIQSIEIVYLRKENNYSGPSVENIYDIFVATSKRLYEFIGSDAKNFITSSNSSASNLVSSLSTTPIFTSIFSYYESKTPNELANFHEMPGDFGYSQLQIRDNNKTRKKTLAWMAGAGILIFELDPFGLAKFSAANFHNETMKRLISESNHFIISYPNTRDDKHDDTGDNNPVGISLTEFHLAIFFRTQVIILCLLNQEIVLNQKLDVKEIGGKIKGIWRDSASGHIGCFTPRCIIKYAPIKESRKIWKIYLKKNEFELAKQFCRDNPSNLNLVLTKQAESLFNSKKYVESAVVYAQTQHSFEEICLKYLELGNFYALRTFLTHKLETLNVANEITQTTIVIAYIIEIFLNQLSDLIQERHFDAFDCLQKEFHKFLDNKKVKDCLKESKKAIYRIFANHGNTSDMVYFADVMKDYSQIIMHYIQEGNYRKALEALAKENDREIYYKYSPIFFEILPKEIVDIWIKNNDLKPVKLLPALASCSLNEDQISEAIRYLEYCVNKLKSEDQEIHDTLLILYIRYHPEELLEYVRNRKDDKNVYFDELMIARLCSERSNKWLNEACVYLYTRMKWYEEAVDLAVNVNVDLAREVANSVQMDLNEIYSDELKKVLWLKIARHVIEKDNDVNKAMNFLQDLNETIAIEDVLPYFPEFVTIDQFKDAIRASLAAYTDKINSLKENIDQAAKSAQIIRREIQTIKQKSCVVNANDTCAKCKFRLMSRRFYVFPCKHKFHSDCLYKLSIPYLIPSKQKRIEEIQKLLHDIQTVPANTGLSGALSHFTKSKANQIQSYSNEEIWSLKSELDDLLAGECPWCGEKILRSIDEPFIDPLDYESVFNSWL